MTGTFVILAGGTGGHIFPGLAVAHELRSRGRDLLWIGTERGMEAELVPPQMPFRGLSFQKLRGGGARAWFRLPGALSLAVRAAERELRAAKASAVIAFGGFASVPGGLAAAMRRIPLVIHEQNSVAGLANRLLTPLARQRLVGFPDALRRSQWVGNPVRVEIAALARARRQIPGDERRIRMLILGGSQGARALNRAVIDALAQLPVDQRPEVRHQLGRAHLEEGETLYQEAGVAADTSGFIDDMAQAYEWADFAVARAGALTLAELACAGLPAILVPFPHAVDDHQTRNAEFFCAGGAGRLLPENELSAERLIREISALHSTLAEASVAAHVLARPDAAVQIADVVEQVGDG